ncbi:hypothetical protein CHS0354_030877 [Potamilus streckersoni]|uniref:Uncharacterized protein n=1 Tax=Potamilus streckersoni TaxID=2493646 RepID=A0AAE0VZB1_9BIVA|nr:hypothetical protein CHS0354_030877 [Potamilus streckersoni]
MSTVIFVGSLYVFITPGFSLYTITNESCTWMDCLDACNKINMSLASQQRVHNTTSLNPSATEAYWIQELEIIKMFPGDDALSAYNESYSITINNDKLQQHCTHDGEKISCTAAENVSNNLIKFGSFSLIIGILNGNTKYRIGVVNYTSLLNETNRTLLIRCVLFYKGKIYSGPCSQRRRAICVEDEIQNYAVSKLDGSIPCYSQQPSSTTGASTTIIDATGYHPDNNITSFTTPSSNHDFTTDVERKATTLYIIIGASVSGAIVLGLVILSCTVCLCRRHTFDVKQCNGSVNRKRRSDKIDIWDTYSEVADSIAKAELSQDHSVVQDKQDIVQYSTPEDAVKFAATKETNEFAIYTMIDPNKKINMPKTNKRNSFEANIYQQVNVVVDTNIYDTTIYHHA